ncbi:type IV pili methyl-accepting chemotaxis transducer N-terminal domain-containing protein [Simplicispira suum]|nr:type IV pili methyl-accepting chemotaxis transducer N-terminal domain-containing protein [Simplicispira suum]
MLSQRITKTYLQVGQSIATAQAALILHASIKQFESHLGTLQAFQPTPAVRSAMAHLATQWRYFKAQLVAPPSEQGANMLYDANEALQQAAHRSTVAYENVSTAPLDHLIGIAGRQRMLTQRMAKFYFYRTWGLYDAPSNMELYLSRAHFTAVLPAIENSPFVSERVKAHVAQVRRVWEPYQQVLFASQNPAQMRNEAERVAELSEVVLVTTDELVALLLAQAQGIAL